MADAEVKPESFTTALLLACDSYRCNDAEMLMA